MRFVAEPISDLRLQRFHRWALLWLTWFANFLDAASAFSPLTTQAQTIGHRWLDRIERVLVAIVMLRTVRHVRCIKSHRPFAMHRLKQSGLSRAVIGSAMRRALHPKDLRQRIEALKQDADVLIARLLERLPRGLTRRRPIRALPEAHGARLQRGALISPLASDTS